MIAVMEHEQGSMVFYDLHGLAYTVRLQDLMEHHLLSAPHISAGRGDHPVKPDLQQPGIHHAKGAPRTDEHLMPVPSGQSQGLFRTLRHAPVKAYKCAVDI